MKDILLSLAQRDKFSQNPIKNKPKIILREGLVRKKNYCLLYTSDAADERSSVDLGGRRLIKKKI